MRLRDYCGRQSRGQTRSVVLGSATPRPGYKRSPRPPRALHQLPHPPLRLPNPSSRPRSRSSTSTVAIAAASGLHRFGRPQALLSVSSQPAPSPNSGGPSQFLHSIAGALQPRSHLHPKTPPPWARQRGLMDCCFMGFFLAYDTDWPLPRLAPYYLLIFASTTSRIKRTFLPSRRSFSHTL